MDAQLTNEAMSNDNSPPPEQTNVVMISLPPTLFDQVFDQASNEDVGLAFTFYESSNLFPLANGTDTGTVIGSSVIGAIVAGKPVLDLPDPVIIVLPLLDPVRYHKINDKLYLIFYDVMLLELHQSCMY